MMNYNSFPIRIPYTLFGNGAVGNVGKVAKELSAKRVLLITDKGIVQSGLIDSVKQPLEKEGIKVAIFADVEPDNPIEIIEQSARAAKKNGCDMMIGVGGGSVMDNTKLASILVTAEDIFKEDMSQYEGYDKITRCGMSKILIPTTAGTGSEWSQPAVVNIDGHKRGVVSPYLLPNVAIVDPLMTLNLPPKVTADTGMDALSHAVEAYTTSLRANVFTDMIEEKAIRLIATNLRGAYAKGSDNIEARYNMSLAAMLACNPMLITGANLGHGMAHALQSFVHITHGEACSLMMCPVLEFNMISNLEKHARIAELMGENVEGLSLQDAAQKGISAIKQLSIDVGMPQRLRDIGMRKEDIEPAVDILFKHNLALVDMNPRHCSRQDIVKIFEAAW